MSGSLDSALEQQVEQLCDTGDQCAENQDFSQANVHYLEALAVLPEPANQWEQGAWVYGSLGETYFHQQDFTQMLENFEAALSCPQGADNPFIHLRLGQAYFEVTELDKAKACFKQVVSMASEEVFADEDSKYLALLKP
ncbi:MAG: tetratricopeptide (TPR) repeat protein [Flavobacteriales bacterium]|jgi:tetratricopeptide (TPR) repeat protein